MDEKGKSGSFRNVFLIILVAVLGMAGLRMFSRSRGSFSDWVGRETPDLTMMTIDGEQVSLSALGDRAVVLVFFATWCPPCKAEVPNLVKIRNEYADSAVEIIAVSQEGVGELKEFRREKGINYKVVSVQKNRLPEPYSDVQAIPTTFFIDSQGIIQYGGSGYKSYEELKKHVEMVLPAVEAAG